MIGRYLGKFLVYEIPSAFDSSLEEGPSWQHGTLQKFLEKCLALAQDLEALVELERFLSHSGKELKYSAVNSL